jgi:hypothetical protein
MSNIAGGTTLTTSLVQTGDTTGNLVFQTNGTTTALTLTTAQNANFANSVSAVGNIEGANINLTGNIVDTGTLTIITGSNGNIALTPNGTGIVTASGAMSAVGNVTGGNVIDSKGEIRTVPINSQTTGYTLVAADLGKFISTNANVTIPASVFSSGQSILVYNNSANNITLLQAANTTVQLAGTATTGNRILAQRGLSTIFCVAANTFVTSGSGLT